MRNRLAVSAGVLGLLALAWGGWPRLRRSHGEARAGSLELALTEKQFESAVAGDGPARQASFALSPLDATLLSRQAAAYREPRARSPLELQMFRRASTIKIRGLGGKQGAAVLIDLNPRINDGYLLELRWSDGEETRLHLENARPDLHRLVLDPAFPSGVVVASRGSSRSCELWSDRLVDEMKALEQGRRPYTEICGGDVLVRHRTAGSRTAREWAADFLRSNVRGGEGLTVLVRETVYADAFLEKAELAGAGAAAPEPADGPRFPRPALVSPVNRDEQLVSHDLGISIPAAGAMVVGRWYPVVETPGVFVSLMTPGRVAPEVLEKSRVRDLDATERGALVYLIAFDLERFDLGFALGTDNPGVGWSERVPASLQDPSLPGPDGFASLAPLEPTGLVPPQVADRVVSTLAGGFKRLHGAFRSGPLARVNSGSHYGFVEGGAVLSKLQPGLATLFALDDGSVGMKTWSRADDALLERIRSARQNGVPLLEPDARTGAAVPGALVGRWAEGNWGGSQDSRLRSVRAGAGLQESAGHRFLVYGYFSNATPSAMAVVLAAYGCRYAMHLDMNAPEHTYLALYRARGGKLDVEHLVREMSVLDKTSEGTTVPRFLGFADNRDFFYVMRKRVPTQRSSMPARQASDPPALARLR